MTMLFYSALLALFLQPVPQPSFIEGTVVDAVSGAPVPQAAVAIRYTRDPAGSRIVTATNTQGATAVTGDDGRFRLEAVPAVPFRVVVYKDSYVPFGELPTPGEQTFTLKTGEGKQGVVLRLQPEGSLSGRVYDPELEKPAAGLRVQALCRKDGDVDAGFWPSGNTTTDESGSYRISGLGAGLCKLLFQSPIDPVARPATPKPAPQPPQYSLLYYPGVSDVDAALAIDLMAGAKLDSLDMKMTRSPNYCIRGIVGLDGPPQPVMLASITPLKLGSMHRMLGRLASPGPFEICHLWPGPIQLSATNVTTDKLLRRQAIYQTVIVDKDLEGVEFHLLPGARVTFEVRSLNLKDTQRDPLWTELRPPIELGLDPLERTIRVSEIPTRIGPDGRHTIENVFFEPLQLSLRQLPDGWVLRQLLYNGQPVSERRFELNSAAPAHHFEVLVAPAPNSLSGEVRSRGKSETGARVLAVAEPVNEHALLYATKRATSDENGRYAISHLVPGAWRIVAIPASEPWRKARDLLLSGAGERRDIPESGSISITLDTNR